MKFSVLIVDDEYIICENIRSKIELLNLNKIGEIKTCYSGEEALEICKSYKPEIVITDIKMGEINGIELIRNLKKKLYPVFFIVLSGYDDYKYVRSAFQEGVNDYLLKPILTEQLQKILNQQCEKLMNKTNCAQESRSSLVMVSEKLFAQMSKLPGEGEMQELQEEVLRFLGNKEYMFLKIGFNQNVIRHNINRIINLLYDLVYDELGYRCLCAAKSDQKIDLLLNNDDIDYELTIVFARKLMEEIAKYNVGIPAVGVSVNGNISELFRMNYQAENNLCYRITEGYGEVFLGEERGKVSEIPKSLKKSTLNLIKNTELMLHTNIWVQIEKSILHLDVIGMKRYYNFFVGLIYSGISDQEDKKEIEFPIFYEFTSGQDLVKALKNMFIEYIGLINEHEDPENIVDNVREYIDQNFTKKLMLSEIADNYFISYSYLSKIFHETYGASFQEYLISKRMSYAEQLLQGQTMSLQEIAEAVGYSNVFNFSRAFKKYFGESPAYYRRK